MNAYRDYFRSKRNAKNESSKKLLKKKISVCVYQTGLNLLEEF